MLMLTTRSALTQQNLDQNTLSLTLWTLGVGVSSERRAAEIHSPVPWPHVTRRVGSEPATHIHRADTGCYSTNNCSSMCVWKWLLVTWWLALFQVLGIFLLLLWELRWLTEDTFCRGISLGGSSVIVHQVRLHTWERRTWNVTTFID